MRWAKVMVAGVAVAVGMVAGALLIDRRSDRPRTTSIDENSIVLLGDSITAEGTWSELLADYPVVNAGRSGFTTAELLPVAAEVATAHPRLLLILTGTNDIRDHQEPTWTRRHLGELISVVRQTSPTTRIVVQTILPRADRAVEVIAANNAIRSLAADDGVEVLDLYVTFDDGTGALRQRETSDGVHLSDAGYERWVTVLQPILPES